MEAAGYLLEEEPAAPEGLWAGVERLVERAPGLAHLRRHRLHLIAARRWRSLGRPLPGELKAEERRAAMTALAAPVLLERLRAGYHGPIVLVKGPEVAGRYPNPAMRDFVDLDVLVPDAAEAQRSLIAAGFIEFGDPELYVDIHHLRPLYSPGLHLRVEIHSEPKWPDGLEPPPSGEFFAETVPSMTGVDGILTLPPAKHAVVLAVHGWAHEPLARLGQLVDVAAMLDGADRQKASEVAGAWGVSGVWETTIRAVDALFGDPPARSAALAIWARHLPSARERSVLESHLETWISGFWSLPPGRAALRMGHELWWDIRPTPGESWRSKLSRSGRAFRHAFLPRSEHDRTLGPEASRRRDRAPV